MQRTQRIAIRITPEEKAEIEAAAQEASIDTAVFVRATVLAAIRGAKS